MNRPSPTNMVQLSRLRRSRPGEEPRVSAIGEGGGKAGGLLRAHALPEKAFATRKHLNFQISVPRRVVVGTEVFQSFMKHNRPAEYDADLRPPVASFTTPLAVRSSSLLKAPPHEAARTIDWTWPEQQPTNLENEFVRHIRLKNHLAVQADGRTPTGIVIR